MQDPGYGFPRIYLLGDSGPFSVTSRLAPLELQKGTHERDDHDDHDGCYHKVSYEVALHFPSLRPFDYPTILLEPEFCVKGLNPR